MVVVMCSVSCGSVVCCVGGGSVVCCGSVVCYVSCGYFLSSQNLSINYYIHSNCGLKKTIK